jgi:hypothetical protein
MRKVAEGSGCGIIQGTIPGLRKITKNLRQDSRSPGQDLNPGHPENEAGMLTTRSDVW